MDLLIMAAGMGSRFGGLKQTAPMGPNDEFIIDYSIYDAIRCGFEKVVFIIKEENYDLFKSTIGKRIEEHIKVEYVFQKMDNIPSFVEVPKDRIKPWGTAQAIYCAKDVIHNPFVVINADDFYGYDAFLTSSNYIKENENPYALVGYEASKTLTENGSVKRGVIYRNNQDELVSIKESSLVMDGDEIKCEPLNGEEVFKIKKDDLVSMNMLVLNPNIFTYIEQKMNIFFKETTDLTKAEFLIPDVIKDAQNESFANFKILHTKAKWFGVTYKEDSDNVKNAIKKLIDDGVYPNNLWN